MNQKLDSMGGKRVKYFCFNSYCPHTTPIALQGVDGVTLAQGHYKYPLHHWPWHRGWVSLLTLPCIQTDADTKSQQSQRQVFMTKIDDFTLIWGFREVFVLQKFLTVFSTKLYQAPAGKSRGDISSFTQRYNFVSLDLSSVFWAHLYCDNVGV